MEVSGASGWRSRARTVELAERTACGWLQGRVKVKDDALDDQTRVLVGVHDADIHSPLMRFPLLSPLAKPVRASPYDDGLRERGLRSCSQGLHRHFYERGALRFPRGLRATAESLPWGAGALKPPRVFTFTAASAASRVRADPVSACPVRFLIHVHSVSVSRARAPRASS